MTNVLNHLGMADVVYGGPVPKISVVILAHNESGNIGECLRSCAWCDDVHVVDSGSTDETVSMAGAMGATVHHHDFESFGNQRNWAIDHGGCRHAWQFHLDADERFTDGLVREIAGCLSDESNGAVAYLVPSRMVFLGQWLRRSGGYPGYQMRLFRSDQCRFQDVGHGQREDTRGAVGVMGEPYIHFNFSKGIEAWLRKHNRYSDQEAISALAEPLVLSDMFSGDGVLRRRALKRLSQRLPFRGAQRWVYTMLIKGGFIDGAAGKQYVRMICMYERWVERKIRDGRGCGGNVVCVGVGAGGVGGVGGVNHAGENVVGGREAKTLHELAGRSWTARIDHQIDRCVCECDRLMGQPGGVATGRVAIDTDAGTRRDGRLILALLMAERGIRQK